MPKRATDWESVYLAAIGAPNSAQNRRLLASWQRWEGGHTNNDARFNYLNTTQKMHGSHSINSVGVQAYGSLAQGARAFARTLRNGKYNDLLGGFQSGNPYAANVTAGLSTWLSGSPDSSAGIHYAEKVMGTKVPPPAVQQHDTGSGPGQHTSGVGSIPDALNAHGMDDLSHIAQGNFDPLASLQSLTDSLIAAGKTDVAAPNVANDSPGKIKMAGTGYASWVPGRTGVGGLHPTSGLPGYTARDVFGRPGTGVFSPVNGTVIKVSGHDPKLGAVEGAGGPLGWSVYIKDDHGHTWYVTHLGTRPVKVGEKISRGMKIGTIANYDKYGRKSHAHVGEHP